MTTARRVLLMAALAVALAGADPADEEPSVDWSQIPSRTLELFYPGQSSYQWLLSAAHEPGHEEMAAGESCLSCHEGEEEAIGDAIVSGGHLEPTPPPGKPGTLKLKVQIAYDARNAFFRFQWETGRNQPGEAHPFLRFDGQRWQAFGGPRLDADVREGRQPAVYEDRLSMMIDDGSVPRFDVHGCWLTCHDGERDMRGEAPPEAVRSHPVLGRGGLGRHDVRKYLPSTRTADHWARTKSRAEITQLLARGEFLDLMQWRAHRSNPVGMADDFYVLEYRRMDAGQGPFVRNWDEAEGRPAFMYDPGKCGSGAARMHEIGRRPTALVRERNALPFDPSLDWKEGDLIPAYVTGRAAALGSAADNRDVSGRWEDGGWTVIWTRPLGLSNPDDKTLRAGGVYHFSFAVHDDNMASRGHHVSWPVSVGFGAEAEIEATKLPRSSPGPADARPGSAERGARESGAGRSEPGGSGSPTASA